MRQRLVPVLVTLAILVSGLLVTACGGSEDPEGTVTSAITIGTDGAATNPGGGAAAGGEGGETTGGEGGETTAEEPEEGAAGDTGQTTEAEAGGDANDNPGDPAAGKEVYASAGCGTCHTLEDAGSNGQVGPNLDEARPDYEQVVEYVTNGKGAMPSFKDRLSEEDIQNVANYVSDVTGSGEEG